MQTTAEAESRPKSAHRYNVAEQQQIYKSEVERIWKAQFDSLSRKDEPPLTEEDEREFARKARDAAAAQQRPEGMRDSPMPSDDREASMAPDSVKKVMRIKRLVSICVDIARRRYSSTTKIDGVWKTEIVRDPAVIRAYIRKAQIYFGMREYSKCVDACNEATEIDNEHHSGANAREIDQQQQKALQAMYAARENETEEQTKERLQRDPEVSSRPF